MPEAERFSKNEQLTDEQSFECNCKNLGIFFSPSRDYTIRVQMTEKLGQIQGN